MINVGFVCFTDIVSVVGLGVNRPERGNVLTLHLPGGAQGLLEGVCLAAGSARTLY
jgi:hypothetical protein